MSSSSLLTHYILGVPVHTLSQVEPQQMPIGYRQWILEQLGTQGAQVITCNAEMVIKAQQSPAFLAVMQQADLITPDGAGVVWALGRQGIRVVRSPGIELAEDLLAALAELRVPVALLGGQPENLDLAVQRWQQKYPQLSLWSHHGYFTPEQEPQILASLATFGAGLILVGLGSPRQEFWIQRHRQVLPQAIWMGVGGSFDIWAGMKQRAPAWWRAHQLEWLYRLYQEPWRWRRMLALPQFAWRVMQHPLPQISPTSHPDPKR